MKLYEIFNPDYYDFIQDEMKRKQFDRDEDISSDTETSMQDFIISQFEAGDITYDQALKKLKEITPDDEMFFYKMELNAAQDLMND